MSSIKTLELMTEEAVCVFDFINSLILIYMNKDKDESPISINKSKDIGLIEKIICIEDSILKLLF